MEIVNSYNFVAQWIQLYGNILHLHNLPIESEFGKILKPAHDVYSSIKHKCAFFVLSGSSWRTFWKLLV